MKITLIWAVLLVCGSVLVSCKPQSNYADRGLDVEYQGNGIPQEATLDGIVTKLDDLSHTIRTNRFLYPRFLMNQRLFLTLNSFYRTTASLSCASRAMEVDLEFTEPFYGIVYADFSRSSACSFVGKGGLSYHYELPLTGCGTIQVTRHTQQHTAMRGDVKLCLSFFFFTPLRNNKVHLKHQMLGA